MHILRNIDLHVWILKTLYQSEIQSLNLTQPMDPEKKSVNFIFPIKYGIPKSLKFSHWPSKELFAASVTGFRPKLLLVEHGNVLAVHHLESRQTQIFILQNKLC